MSIASELQDKINAKTAIKTAIEAKGVAVGNVKLNQYAAKVDAIAQDPSIPVGTGQWLITWWDYDGKILKRQRVNTGENGTDPPPPQHQYLTFAEYNNPTTNVQSDIDTGAIYNTTDGKTYLFITLTPVTGLAPTLYFSKSSTSLMAIDWGDGTTSTSTTSGNQSINHVYATAGDYIITVDNSAGGTWSAGQGAAATALFSNTAYKDCLTRLYIGNYISLSPYCFATCNSLSYISTGNYVLMLSTFIFTNCRNIDAFISGVAHRFQGESIYGIKICVYRQITTYAASNFVFANCYNLNKFIMPSLYTIVGDGFFANCYNIKTVFLFNLIGTIGASAFSNCLNMKQLIIYSTTPPTLANINAFSGINPICKIYVPDASVEAYKTATNWVTYANYIYPLSQKPQSNE